MTGLVMEYLAPPSRLINGRDNVSKQLLLLGTPMTAAELLALVPAKYLRRIEAPDLPAVTREIARGGQRWNW